METNQQDTATFLSNAIVQAGASLPDRALVQVAAALDSRDIDPTGAWVAYYWTGEGNKVLAIHGREIDALRYAVNHGWATGVKVKFVKYGEEDSI